MRLPAHGRGLWQQRRMGKHPIAAQLIIGSDWKARLPENEFPRMCLKPQAWHTGTFTYDWRVVEGLDVYVFDTRQAKEITLGPADWDSWFWLLADVRSHARTVVIFTPTIEFKDPAAELAPERELLTLAWCLRRYDSATQRFLWPPWYASLAKLKSRAA